ncbi:MAG: glycosyltransferase family 2 protein [Chloroflexota bacterium]|nr:glycosyltransferase family 2 protein [Chloroflexota bacterium]
MRQQPVVSIVVVNYNGIVHIEECLTALFRQRDYPTYEVIVVDNASTDESAAYIRLHFPGALLVTNEQNLGYSGAVNRALSRAKGRYIAVLNMDAVVEPDWLHPLVAFLEKNPQAGAVTPQILLYQDAARINALGQNIHVSGLGFNRAYRRPRMIVGQAPVQVSGIHGSAFLIRREILEQMGGMNERCFMYHEDVDVSWVVRLMGYDIYCIPGSIVHHKYTLFMNPWKLYYLERNRISMLLCNLSWPTFLLILPFLILTELMMAVYCLRRGRRFLEAKGRSLFWNWQNRKHIYRRRSRIQRLRRCSDWQVVANLRLNYEWDQLLALSR